jgi:hypothetical protein
MRTFLALWTVVGLSGLPAGNARADATAPPALRFVPVAVRIDTGGRPLAAWQVEIRIASGDARIVGVEGGEHPAFAEPAYYDRAALRERRIVLAAFHTGNDLPSGTTRVATLHLAVTGDADPTFDAELVVAAGPDGRRFAASVSIGEGGM